MSDAPDYIYIDIDDNWKGCRLCRDGKQTFAHDHDYPDSIKYWRAEIPESKLYHVENEAQAKRIDELEAENARLKEQTNKVKTLLKGCNLSYSRLSTVERIQECIHTLSPIEPQEPEDE